MYDLIARFKAALARVSAWLAGFCGRFVQPQHSLQDLLSMGASIETIVKEQFSAAANQESLYLRTGCFTHVLARNRHLDEARRVLQSLDKIIAGARTKLVEIETSLELPVKRGEKPDKLVQQNLRAVQRHVGRMESRARKLHTAVEAQIGKQVVSAPA